MRNTDFQIRLVLRSGWTQLYYRDKKSWHQVTNGVDRTCTAEQVLNHLLPAFFKADKGVSVQITVPREKLDGRV